MASELAPVFAIFNLFASCLFLNLCMQLCYPFRTQSDCIPYALRLWCDCQSEDLRVTTIGPREREVRGTQLQRCAECSGHVPWRSWRPWRRLCWRNLCGRLRCGLPQVRPNCSLSCLVLNNGEMCPSCYQFPHLCKLKSSIRHVIACACGELITRQSCNCLPIQQ